MKAAKFIEVYSVLNLNFWDWLAFGLLTLSVLFLLVWPLGIKIGRFPGPKACYQNRFFVSSLFLLGFCLSGWHVARYMTERELFLSNKHLYTEGLIHAVITRQGTSVFGASSTLKAFTLRHIYFQNIPQELENRSSGMLSRGLKEGDYLRIWYVQNGNNSEDNDILKVDAEQVTR